MDDAAVTGCLRVAGPTAQDDMALAPRPLLLSAKHLLKGKVAVDVRVENKESRGVSSLDLVPEVVQSTGRPERAVLLQVPASGGGAGGGAGEGQEKGRAITAQS